MEATFKVDVKKSAAHIRRYLNFALQRGHILQSKGGGVAGSFKLSENSKKFAEAALSRIQGKTFLPRTKLYPKKPREKTDRPKQPSHPSYAEMIDSAIVELNDPRGSSTVAIKKHIIATYPMIVNKAKFSKHVTRHINASLETGHYVQTRGSGASGSIKLWDIYTKAAALKRSQNNAREKKSVKPKVGTGKIGRPRKDEASKKSVSKAPVKESKKTESRAPARASKTAEAPAKKVGRGRPPKKTPTKRRASSSSEESAYSPSPSKKVTVTDIPAKKKGRPPKASPGTETQSKESSVSPAKKMGRGRPPKKAGRGRPSKK